MATVVNYSKNPPANGDWYDDGWGGWTDDPKSIGVIPQGYFNCWGNLLAPTNANPTLDSKTVVDTTKALGKAKEFGNTQFGKIFTGILTYGNSFVDLLIKARIIADVSMPISYDNIDPTILATYFNNGGLTQTNKTSFPNQEAPTKSTFLGIDFSNPVNVIAVLGFILLIVYVTRSPTKI